MCAARSISASWRKLAPEFALPSPVTQIRCRGLATNAFGSSLPDVVRSAGWDGAWKQHVTPWDAGCATPVINVLLTQRSLPSGPILVPGCGAGYDVEAFAAAGRTSLGIDLSSTAIDHAKSHRVQNPLASYVVADFFLLKPAEPFAVIFDYTFMSALPPDMWPQWASTMKRLLAPSGRLVTVMFPIGTFAGGPPYAVQPEAVCKLLESAGLMCEHVQMMPPEWSHKARAGRECLGVFAHDTARFPAIHVPTQAG